MRTGLRASAVERLSTVDGQGLSPEDAVASISRSLGQLPAIRCWWPACGLQATGPSSTHARRRRRPRPTRDGRSSEGRSGGPRCWSLWTAGEPRSMTMSKLQVTLGGVETVAH